MKGTLTVKPICANLIHDLDLFGKMDPYVNVSIGNQYYKTKTAHGAGKTPNWSESFTFRVNDETQMTFELYDSDIGQDDFIGSGFIDLTPVFIKRNINEWYPVNKASKKQNNIKANPSISGIKGSEGQILFIMEFIPQNMPNNQMPNNIQGYNMNHYGTMQLQPGYTPQQGFQMQPGQYNYPTQQGYHGNNTSQGQFGMQGMGHNPYGNYGPNQYVTYGQPGQQPSYVQGNQLFNQQDNPLQWNIFRGQNWKPK